MKGWAKAAEALAGWFNTLPPWRGRQRVWGRSIRASTFDRWLYLQLHRWGWMGADEQRLLATLIRPGMTVVDVGGNLGLYTVLLAHQVGPTGRVVAFEPDPDLFALLAENCAANGCPWVECHNLALGRAPTRMVLNRMSLNSGDNHLSRDAEKAFYRPMTVAVESLDHLLPDLRPDLVKIDVQGWELEVLRGMEAVLRSTPGIGVLVEFWPEGMRRAGYAPEDLFTFLRGLDFRLFLAGEGSELDQAGFAALTRRLPGLKHADLLARRSEKA